MLTQLLTTKLYIPSLRLTTIPRPRLVERLDNEIAYNPLTLIAAPAGFGKTTVLSAWLDESGRQAAWLSLDEGDNEPARFLAYCIAALQTHIPDMGAGAQTLLQSAPLPPLPVILTGLLNEIAAEDEAVILILDDYHVIDNDSVHQAVMFLVEYAPPNFHVIITTRTDPPLPLARLRARGQLLELRAADLRFTPDEIRAFFDASAPEQLSEDDVSFLDEKTEGWAAGLQLAALSLRGRRDIAAFLREFRGSNRYILSYLADEVLAMQPEPVQQFLTQTAILERLSAPLCAAVTGQDGSRQQLEYLVECNLFIVPLDDTGEWYRYHHLFADVLRHRLQQQSPEMVAELHERASRWHEQGGMIEGAINHALAAGDHERAARLLGGVSRDLLKQGGVNIVRNWINALPAGIVQSNPDLCLAYGWIQSIMGGGAIVKEYAGHAERALRSLPGQHPHIEGELAALHVQIAMSERDFPLGITLGERALAQIAPEDANMRGLVWLHLGSAYRLTGRMEEAVNAYQETIRLARLSGSLLQMVYALHNLAALYEVCAELDRAYDSYYEIIRLAASTPLPNAGLGDLGVGKVLRERNQLDEAEAHLRKAALSGRRHRIDGVIADSSITLALVSMARRDWQAAQAYLNDAREVVQHWQQGDTLLRLRTFEARFALLRGDLAAAERWRDEAGVSVNDEPTDNDAIEQIMLARLLIARGDIQPALSFIARLLQKAESDGRAAQVIELLNLRALANDAAERESEARAALNQALALAQPGGCIRVFLDEGERLIELLQQAIRSGGEGADYARVVLSAAQRPTAKAQPAAVSSSHELVETLSERELEVLGLVAEGLTNQEIADRLYLARATVKKHIENIFGKLLVNNRTQAVTRARELGLL